MSCIEMQYNRYTDKKNMDEQNQQVPYEFLCPIFQQIMKDPVLTADGFCFERRAITQWFNKGRNTNPLTNKNLNSTILVQNRVLRQVIELHNTRIRQIQRKANDTAKQIIVESNQTISEVFPELIDHNGMVSLDKLVQVSVQVTQLRNSLKNSNQKFSELKRSSQQSSNCQQCKYTSQLLKRYGNYLQKQVQPLLKTNPLIEERRIKRQQIPYLLMNTECIKGIDFRRIKASDLTKYLLEGVLIQKLTIEEIIAKVRLQRKIPAKDFIRIWITDMPIQDLYKHIVEQVESITGTYICKVKCVGKKVEMLKKKVKELEMSERDYWIVEHGPLEQYVFRNDETKCDYCYKIKKVECQCDCKKVFYCSKQCYNKDKGYHERVCKLIPGNASNSVIKQ